MLNNPINASDPTGHYCVGDLEGCRDEMGEPVNDAPLYLGQSGGGRGGNEDENDSDNNLGLGGGYSCSMHPEACGNGSENPDFFSEVAYIADNVGVITSDIELIVVDTMGVIVIVGGCATVAGCGPALVYALAIDLGVSWFSPLGVVENISGAVGAGATGLSDIINGTTYLHLASDGGYDIGIGRDTVVSTGNLIAGLVPEANYDAWISNKQLEYDNLRRSGALPAVSQFEWHFSPSPNLWGDGNGWPNSSP